MPPIKSCKLHISSPPQQVDPTRFYLGPSANVGPIFRHFLASQEGAAGAGVSPAGVGPMRDLLLGQVAAEAAEATEAGGGGAGAGGLGGLVDPALAKIYRLRWQLLTLKKYLCSK